MSLHKHVKFHREKSAPLWQKSGNMYYFLMCISYFMIFIRHWLLEMLLWSICLGQTQEKYAIAFTASFASLITDSYHYVRSLFSLIMFFQRTRTPWHIIWKTRVYTKQAIYFTSCTWKNVLSLATFFFFLVMYFILILPHGVCRICFKVIKMFFSWYRKHYSCS